MSDSDYMLARANLIAEYLEAYGGETLEEQTARIDALEWEIFGGRDDDTDT